MNTIAVVVTYNRKALLIECLNALDNQTTPVSKIIVVDNASTDGTGDLFSENAMFAREPFYYHHMEKNLGGAGGFHEGVKLAHQMKCDWIWIMDDDTIVHPDSLEMFYETMPALADEKVSFLASSVFGPGGEVMNVPHLCHKKAENGYEEWYKHLEAGAARIEIATFVSLLINWKAVDEVGYPVKDFFIWGDDAEYTQRLTRHYGKAYLCGKSVVTHKRAICKAIAIENEDNPNRLKNYYYCYRNLLINAKEYNHGTRSVIRCIVEWNWRCIKILCNKNDKNKWKKIKVFHKGIWGYLLGKYDKEAFKNRLTNR